MVGLGRILAAGLAGGIVANISMILTFRLLGFGWNGGGILLDPTLQSAKVIAVWTRIEPLPLVVSNPLPIALGLLVFGVINGFVYRWVSPVWPSGAKSRGMRMALLLFLLTFAFWEFFTPFNMLGEPLALIGLELLFWGAIAVAEAFTIAVTAESRFKE